MIDQETARTAVPFIVGVPRSGTTLLRMMLDAHSLLAIPQETNFGPALSAFREGGGEAAVEAVVNGPLWDDYGLSATEYADRVEQLEPKAFGEVMRAFFELYAEKQGKPRWGNKTPYYLPRMTLIQELVPEARFLHVIRDGRDVALSTIPPSVWFGADEVQAVARQWSGWLRRGREQADGLRHYQEVRYEELVRYPEPTLQRICRFLELEWEPAMLDYHRDAARKLSAELRDVLAEGELIPRERRLAIHRLVGEPPRQDRVERWRREMSGDDLRRFEQIAGPTLRDFGYELS